MEGIACSPEKNVNYDGVDSQHDVEEADDEEE